MRRLILAIVATLGLTLGAAPADAHFLAAGVISPDAYGDCHVNSVYGTFGNAFAQIDPTSAGCDGFYTQVGVTTAYQGQSWTAWCSMGAATFSPTQWCYWAGGYVRAVAPGQAFAMHVYLVSNGSAAQFGHGAFG